MIPSCIRLDILSCVALGYRVRISVPQCGIPGDFECSEHYSILYIPEHKDTISHTGGLSNYKSILRTGHPRSKQNTRLLHIGELSILMLLNTYCYREFSL